MTAWRDCARPFGHAWANPKPDEAVHRHFHAAPDTPTWRSYAHIADRSGEARAESSTG
jgi:hypothetical protein